MVIVMDNVKCKLIAYEKCSKTTITFFKEYYEEEKFENKLKEFKSNKKIYKIVKVENDIEEILYEKVQTADGTLKL